MLVIQKKKLTSSNPTLCEFPKICFHHTKDSSTYNENIILLLTLILNDSLSFFKISTLNHKMMFLDQLVFLYNHFYYKKHFDI